MVKGGSIEKMTEGEGVFSLGGISISGSSRPIHTRIEKWMIEHIEKTGSSGKGDSVNHIYNEFVGNSSSEDNAEITEVRYIGERSFKPLDFKSYDELGRPSRILEKTRLSSVISPYK